MTIVFPQPSPRSRFRRQEERRAAHHIDWPSILLPRNLKPGDHAGGLVLEHVTMQHPLAGVVGDEGPRDFFPRTDQHLVEPGRRPVVWMVAGNLRGILNERAAHQPAAAGDLGDGTARARIQGHVDYDI